MMPEVFTPGRCWLCDTIALTFRAWFRAFEPALVVPACAEHGNADQLELVA